MKYVLLFCGSDADAAAFAAMSPDQLRERYAEVGAWFQKHHDKIKYTDQLQHPSTATTVRHDWSGNSEPVVTDGPFMEAKESIGPFMEAKESIGGYASIEVSDLDEALRMARTWPGKGSVEIRPVMTLDQRP